MALDREIAEIVDKGMTGAGLEEEEIAKLFSVDPYSAEGSYIRWGGWMLSRKATGGVAEIHAQIGMDASACPKDCEFCSFAESNGLRPERLEMPVDEVLEYAKAYDEAGVNLICLMVTANYDFDHFLEMGHAVRGVIRADMPLMANIDDFDLSQARQLKDAGFDAVYHVIHMGEGEVTKISPQTRIQTMKNAKEAGLSLSTCIEPIGPEHSPEEIAHRIKQMMEFEPVSSGAGLRVPVPGTRFEKDPRKGKIDWCAASGAFRLAVGLKPRLCGNTYLAADSGANYGWAEVGTNPRDEAERTGHKAGIGHGVEESKYGFLAVGWQVLQGPSQGWRL